MFYFVMKVFIQDIKIYIFILTDIGTFEGILVYKYYIDFHLKKLETTLVGN